MIARIDELKGAGRALGTLAPERLSALRSVSTIESISSSSRIKGSKFSDREVEKLLSNLEIKSFETRDEQDVAELAAALRPLTKTTRRLALGLRRPVRLRRHA